MIFSGKVNIQSSLNISFSLRDKVGMRVSNSREFRIFTVAAVRVNVKKCAIIANLINALTAAYSAGRES